MKKKKYLQIFNYLKEFSKLRSDPVRDIEIQETQYPEKFWISEIPVNELCENVISADFNDDNDYWVKIKKPKEPVKPAFAKLSANLEKWIDIDSLTDENKEPKLQTTLEFNSESLSVNDFPEINQELNNYINHKWINDLIEYNEKIDTYNKVTKEFDRQNNVYKQLFRIFNKTQQFGEEYELVIGIGLLNFKENSSRPRIFRHILTQRIDINFEYSQKDSQIIISPNLESSPQIETDAILDLFDQFDSQNIIDAEKAFENYIKVKNIDTLFSDPNIDDALQMFAERISPDGSYDNSVEKPNSTPIKPIISFSPAIILRKRNTRSFTALFEKIIGNIESDTDEIDIPTINDLIEFNHHHIPHFSDDSNLKLHNDVEPIFFPKEYNAEQIEIIEKARKNNKVLVQGPPGTGKSHTIANLICHLLANGKKVLITAYTKRALEVLKDKLPQEFQDLTVNLLSGDSSSIQNLQSSVNSINEELSRANLSAYQNEIKELENRLIQVREKIASNTNELINIKEKATRNHEFNLNYSGTLTQIAELLEADSSVFKWYCDSFGDITDTQIISDLGSYTDLFNHYKAIDISSFEYNIPDLIQLPTLDQIRESKFLSDSFSQSYSSSVDYINIKCADFENLKTKLNQLKELYKLTEDLQIDFTRKLIEDFLNNNAQKWFQTLQNSALVLNRIEKIDLRIIDKDIEVSYPENKSLKQLKKDAQTLLTHLKEGNALSGLAFKLKKHLLQKEIRERLYFIENVKVNGSNCDSIDEFETVLIDITINQDLDEISELWGKGIPAGSSYLNKFNYFIQIHSDVSKLINIIGHSQVLRNEVEALSNILIKPFDNTNIESLLKALEYNYLLNHVSIAKEIIKNAVSYLNHGNFHPIKEKLLSSLSLMDYHAYGVTLKEIESLNNTKKHYQDFLILGERLTQVLPNILTSIHSGNFSKQNIIDFQNAIFFRHAQKEIEKLINIEYEQGLLQDFNDFETKQRKIIASLAAKKAWYSVVESLQHNRSLRQHLDAWVMAVKKIGKTGKGKRALKFRKIAQQEMEHCKNSVPCWIMPLYKVAETITPVQEMYDYVIIDEASQLGPDAIFLLYISKNIIIVGDDKQTSPEYVGVDANTMSPHIKRHLSGIPFSDYYGTEFSFFDHAKFFCDGVTVLREHFRCMPEIIEFSNKYFYAPDGKGLYPLKQYSENRLEPLMSVFCSNGFVDGRGAQIINENEAKQITATITRLIEDERYHGKTFGVITLQGNQQSSLIENLLLKNIGEQEFHKRKIICGNSSSFQGDERDIIFLSLVTAHNHNRSAFVKPEDERRFNVGVSRAKEQIWLFHSVQLDDLSNTHDLRYKLLDHFKNYNSKQLVLNSPIERNLRMQPDPFDSWFEVDVYNDIVNKGLSVIPQYEVAKGKYFIDLVTLFPDGTKIAIECDGDKWHGPEQHLNDIMRQKVLERCGWQFFRVRGYEYYTNRINALNPLWEMIPKIKIKENFQHTVTPVHLNEVSELFVPSLVSDVDSLPVLFANEISNEIEEPDKEAPNLISNENKVIRYFNLFISGKYVLSTDNPLTADFVVPIKSNQTKGYLMQCYSSGNINKVHISVLLSKKIGKEYNNGLNKEGELTYLTIIESEKIVGIYFYENGKRKFKAHLTENISTRDLLQLKGYKVIYSDFENIEYTILPLTILNNISRLVYQSFLANGKLLDNHKYDIEWLAIKEYNSNEVQLENKFNSNIVKNQDIKLVVPLASKVELTSIVKIKYLNTDKILPVQFVNYQPQSMLLSNGILKLNLDSPLAKSLKGKSIGDKVKIGTSDRYVEILEIY